MTTQNLELSGKIFKVLDKGYVKYIDHMGTDADICHAARISYGKQNQIRTTEEDRNLIRYMFSGAYEMKAPHSSPFEQVELKLQIRIPMDAWRQYIRHRTANVNEYSTRYSEAIDDKQKTPPDQWRSQSKANKQGSGNYLSEQYNEFYSIGEYLSQREQALHHFATIVYDERLRYGVAKEQARKDLPLSTYTEAIWKIDLHNLFHFLKLRMDHHAQKEIRDYANIIGNEIVAKLWPIAWEAFLDYEFYTIKFSRQELQLLRVMMSKIDLTDYYCGEILPNKREREAFLNKMERIKNQ